MRQYCPVYEFSEDNYWEIVGYELRNIDIYTYDPIVENERQSDETYNSIVFSGASVGGETKSIEIYFYASYNSDLEEEGESEKIYIHFRKISKHYYNFQRSLKEYFYSSGDFWTVGADPYILYNNIKNGYGIFAGYAEVVDSTQIFIEW
jgi:hypothetical protein